DAGPIASDHIGPADHIFTIFPLCRLLGNLNSPERIVRLLYLSGAGTLIFPACSASRRLREVPW
ncbi:MAG: hypothetical protein J2P29_12740, partial [Actinobacteria bacterium]|nr:hypothetical protein [Actinomycetota bacterium]